jgi:hypothetical protein
MRSVNGSGSTIIVGLEPEGTNAVRCVYLAGSAEMIGFTLSNGYTSTSGDLMYDGSGGGAFLETNTCVSECMIIMNSADYSGGGIYFNGGGVVNNCVVSANSALLGGGMSFDGGQANNCLINGNTALKGGGVYCVSDGLLNNCTISKNLAEGYGGGVFSFDPSIDIFSAILYAGQTIDSGSVSVGNDAGYLTIHITTKVGWHLTESHVAVATRLEDIPQTKKDIPIPGKFYYKTVHDPIQTEYIYIVPLDMYSPGTLLYIAVHAELVLLDSEGNVIQAESGWVDGIEFEGDNWATYFNYTVQECVNTGGIGVRNSIIYFNNAPNGQNYLTSVSGMTTDYSCSKPLPAGTENISENPQFISTGENDFHLQSVSPCINTGTNAFVHGEEDLDGNQRLYDNTVDMGAYEVISE